jgi:CO dehydrogenase maturation factor
MAVTIAVGGKGGSGKTTIAAMIIRSLIQQGGGPVLAVDADPNWCLGPILGVEPVGTVADVREQVRDKSGTAGGDRIRLAEYGVQRVITEANGFDLLTMGRPEGPGCYCAVNSMLRRFLDELGSQYSYVVIDNEAGMEHLSRRTTNNVDILVVVAEPSSSGIVAARRILELVAKLPIAVRRIGVIWNRTDRKPECDGLPDDVESLGYVPQDDSVLQASMQGKNVFALKADSPAFSVVREMVECRLSLVAPAGRK